MRILSVLVILLVLLTAACAEPDESVKAGAKEAAPPTESAATQAALCSEHGVLEALCTKCHPALIPVFKARFDWCEEHSFPESICPTCHPEKGGRPSVEVASDGAPADGTKVRFKTKETARLAGILTAKAVSRPVEAACAAPARIVYDATRMARIVARAPGVVREIHADVGTRIRRGAALAVIESAGVGADASSLRSARTQVAVAEAEFARETRLRDEGISPERDVLAAQRSLEEARAGLAAAESALGVIGAGADSTGRYSVTSPIAGVVVRRGANAGQLVHVEDELFEIVDTSFMWAEIDIGEADLPSVRSGQRVVLRVEALAGREFTGELAYVAPEIDAHTRTAAGRVALANSDGQLRANMFADAHIYVSGPNEWVLVPRSAVQHAKSADLVFVRVSDDTFEARRVKIRSSEGDLIALTGRVRSGDDVATEGSFLLKTETLKDSIGAGCCDVD